MENKYIKWDLNHLYLSLPDTLIAEHSIFFGTKDSNETEDEKGEIHIEFEDFPESVTPEIFTKTTMKPFTNSPEIKLEETKNFKGSNFEFYTLMISFPKSKDEFFYFASFRLNSSIGKIRYTPKKRNDKLWNQILNTLSRQRDVIIPKSGNKILCGGEICLELPNYYEDYKTHEFYDKHYKMDSKIILSISREEFKKDYKDVYGYGDQYKAKIIPILKKKDTLPNESQVELQLLENNKLIKKIWVSRAKVKWKNGKFISIQLQEEGNPDFSKNHWKPILQSIELK
ncbi:MAG TPA: hypothetical protein PLM36_01795 [Leptospiraceae bacterium]|nr:hypothetical protein [Leptospiraceae bacterium]HMY29748.1 hypothetical protein [Leptospiraceae bacterium]HNM87771.1 hypothetical protein [Leptospiraceae bacterium]